MNWLREDGITGMETVILFVIVGILTFAVIPYYNSLTNQAHDAKIKAMYSILNASVIGASVDSVAMQGYKSVPDPSQITMKNTAAWFDSKNWTDNNSGKWTYRPTCATIVYNKISRNDYTLLLNLENIFTYQLTKTHQHTNSMKKDSTFVESFLLLNA